MTYYVIVCTKQFTYMPTHASGKHTPGPSIRTYAAWNEGDGDGPPGLASLYFNFVPDVFGAARFSSEKDAQETLVRMHPYKSDCFSVMRLTLNGEIINVCN